MPDSRPLGFLCTCGAIVAIPGVELEEGETLEEKQHKLMLKGWQMIPVHQGCPRRGIGKVLTSDKLLLVP